MNLRRRRLSVLALALASAGTACTPRVAAREDPGARVLAGAGDRPYVAGSPAQREALEGLVARLGAVQGDAYLELARRIAAFGERAIPPLLGALTSPDPTVRGQAVYILGALKDRRAIPAIADTALADPEPRVRYEAAAALLGLRDPRGLDVLVSGLEDPDARLRGKCGEVLQEETGLRLGFEPDDPPADRAAAVRRWRAWLAARAASLPAPEAPEPPAPAEGAEGGARPAVTPDAPPEPDAPDAPPRR